MKGKLDDIYLICIKYRCIVDYRMVINDNFVFKLANI